MDTAICTHALKTGVDRRKFTLSSCVRGELILNGLMKVNYLVSPKEEGNAGKVCTLEHKTWSCVLFANLEREPTRKKQRKWMQISISLKDVSYVLLDICFKRVSLAIYFFLFRTLK